MYVLGPPLAWELSGDIVLFTSLFTQSELRLVPGTEQLPNTISCQRASSENVMTKRDRRERDKSKVFLERDPGAATPNTVTL